MWMLQYTDNSSLCAEVRFSTATCGSHLACRHTLGQGMDVVSVCGAHMVILAHGPDHSCRDCLLATVQMHEPKHLPTVVHLSAHLLELTSQVHVPVQILCYLWGHVARDLAVRGSNFGCLLRD